MLQIENVSKRYETKQVLSAVSITVQRGEIVALLGPSGCGKTTLLRLIAGLDVPDSGDISLEGRSLLSVPVHERGIGLMFQDNALFPHLNVQDNIAFGLRMRNVPRAAREQRVAELLVLARLEGYAQRDTGTLSGGERQRVALARSLALTPHLLLLDEPLGALDASLKMGLLEDLHAILKQTAMTAIYVTHDRAEAFALANRVAVMNAGHIEQLGTPVDIYMRPRTVFIARFLGLDNVYPVTALRGGEAHTPIGRFPVSGQAAALLLHSSGLSLQSGDIWLEGTLRTATFEGFTYRIEAEVNGQPIHLQMPTATVEGPLTAGAALRIGVARGAIIELAE